MRHPADKQGARTDSRLRDRREHRIFKQLLQMVPGLEQRLMNSPEEELVLVADLVRFVHPRVLSGY